MIQNIQERIALTPELFKKDPTLLATYNAWMVMDPSNIASKTICKSSRPCLLLTVTLDVVFVEQEIARQNVVVRKWITWSE